MKWGNRRIVEIRSTGVVSKVLPAMDSNVLTYCSSPTAVVAIMLNLTLLEISIGGGIPHEVIKLFPISLPKNPSRLVWIGMSKAKAILCETKVMVCTLVEKTITNTGAGVHEKILHHREYIA